MKGDTMHNGRNRNDPDGIMFAEDVLRKSKELLEELLQQRSILISTLSEAYEHLDKQSPNIREALALINSALIMLDELPLGGSKI